MLSGFEIFKLFVSDHLKCHLNSKLSLGRQSTGKVHTPPFSINAGWHSFHRGGAFLILLVLERICMCFYKAIVQSMFKHVASEYAPLVLILQSYSQIFIVLKTH